MDFSKIKLVATDCDGVLTDGGMYYLEDGTEMKRFNVLDGMGFNLLCEHGIKTAIITAEFNLLIKKRAEKLKVDFLITGERDKLKALKKICDQLGITLEETVYIGDDVYDIPAIKASGYGCAPRNAHESARVEADIVTQNAGGEGCFREIVDLLISSLRKNYEEKY